MTFNQARRICVCFIRQVGWKTEALAFGVENWSACSFWCGVVCMCLSGLHKDAEKACSYHPDRPWHWGCLGTCSAATLWVSTAYPAKPGFHLWNLDLVTHLLFLFKLLNYEIFQHINSRVMNPRKLAARSQSCLIFTPFFPRPQYSGLFYSQS